jgi:hypothetical protein
MGVMPMKAMITPTTMLMTKKMPIVMKSTMVIRRFGWVVVCSCGV